MFGLNFDVGHFYCVGDPIPETIERLKAWTQHYHIEDIAESRVHEHLVPGDGAIDFATALDAIRSTGYDDWLTIELYPYLDDPDGAGRRARDFLTKAGLSYESVPFDGTNDVVTTIAGVRLVGFDEAAYRAALDGSGYPKAADPGRVDIPMTVLLLSVLMIYVTMVYGPIAAFLVELFPTRIRYSSMSLPYHIGNGWFGGFLPFIAAALVVKSGNIYYGLWYPIAVAAMTAVIGGLFIKDRRNVDLRA
jgi:hypothetical protein